MFALPVTLGTLAGLVTLATPRDTLTVSEFASKREKTGWVALTNAQLSTKGSTVNESWADAGKTTKEIKSVVLPLLGPDADDQVVHAMIFIDDGPLLETLRALDRSIQQGDKDAASAVQRHLKSIRAKGYVNHWKLAPVKVEQLTAVGLTLAPDYVVIKYTYVEPSYVVSTVLFVLAAFPGLWLFRKILDYRRSRARRAKLERASRKQRSLTA
jgi:hypothetical protein